MEFLQAGGKPVPKTLGQYVNVMCPKFWQGQTYRGTWDLEDRSVRWETGGLQGRKAGSSHEINIVCNNFNWICYLLWYFLWADLYFSGYRCLQKKSLSAHLSCKSLLTPAPPISMLTKISKPWLYMNRLFFCSTVALPEDHICQHWNWGWGGVRWRHFGATGFFFANTGVRFLPLTRFWEFQFTILGSPRSLKLSSPATSLRPDRPPVTSAACLQKLHKTTIRQL